MLELSLRYLEWVHLNSPIRSYQLCAEKREILTLTWQSIRDTTAIANVQNECWLFMCTGYLNRQGVAYTHPVRNIMGTFKPADPDNSTVSGGTLDMSSGETYRLKRVYPLRPEMIWEDASGTPLIRFKGNFTPGSKSGEVELVGHLPDHRYRNIPFLACFGWYLMVSNHLDMALIF